ncbi:hypothetical protein HBI25_142740 [Parastagonospora nodorum]|nr:hypothetical protein HBI10_003250 [Parastagonospora nodorum]KAH4016672.1 hypothetical protein HBI13_151260 [Parastagonospora nodorum]KAH4419842.1 hypothetical protein HBH92_025750 [Parastagonospora nodorum]KAH4452834.1 hypothetical protein HBH93_023210 [Parastagonospora nodorum]KAH4567336.1 hypothetical protein HBH86_032980 [Parastagonospora nodorum]
MYAETILRQLCTISTGEALRHTRTADSHLRRKATRTHPQAAHPSIHPSNSLKPYTLSLGFDCDSNVLRISSGKHPGHFSIVSDDTEYIGFGLYPPPLTMEQICI